MQSRRRKRVVLNGPVSSVFKCTPCRQAKVKCDGEQPSCGRCRRLSRHCCGYAAWQINTSDGHISLGTNAGEVLSRRDTGNDMGMLNEASDYEAEFISLRPIQKARPHIDETSRHALSQLSVTDIVQRSRNPIIASRCLREAFQTILDEPMFFHAVVAVAVMQQAKVPVIHSDLVVTLDSSMHQLGLQHYGKALYNSREAVASSRLPGSALRRALALSFLLFLCELYQGDLTGAKRQRRLSVALTDVFGDDLAIYKSDPSLSAHLRLIQTSNRFNLLSPLLNLPAPQVQDRTNLWTNSSIGKSCLHSVSSICFASVEEAALCSESFVQDAHQFQQDLLTWTFDLYKEEIDACFSQSLERRQCALRCLSRFCPLGRGLKERLADLQDRQAHWRVLFDSWTGHRRKSYVEKLLEVIHFYSSMTLLMCRCDWEQSYDEYTGSFLRIIDVIEDFLLERRRGNPEVFGPSPEHDTPAIGMYEYDIIRALFVIGMKCRVSWIRRRAVKLLHNINITEGEQTSVILAEITDVVSDLEEGRAQSCINSTAIPNVTQAVHIPEAARFLDVVAYTAPTDRTILHLVGGRTKGKGLLEFVEYEHKRDTTKSLSLKHADVPSFSNIASKVDIV